jgi:thiamine pyrophosphokinase
MKRCFIFIGGEGPEKETLPELPLPGDLVIAADSGFDLALQFSVSIDFVLGDFDSVKSISSLESLEEEQIITYPRNKDLTDTELAIEKAFKEHAEELILIGGGGGRLDHLAALMALFERNQCPDRWYGSFGSAYLVPGLFGKDGEGEGQRFNFEEGRMVSFFPLGNVPCVPWSHGLAWKLNGLRWSRGDFGISNKVECKPMRIGTKSGSMLLIVPEEKD